MRESLVKCDGSDVSLIKKAYSTKRLVIGETIKIVELLIAGSSGMYQIDMRNMSGTEFRNQPNITDSDKLYAKGSRVSNDIGLLWSGVIDRRTGQCLRRYGEASRLWYGRHRHDRRPIRGVLRGRCQRGSDMDRSRPLVAGRA